MTPCITRPATATTAPPAGPGGPSPADLAGAAAAVRAVTPILAQAAGTYRDACAAWANTTRQDPPPPPEDVVAEFATWAAGGAAGLWDALETAASVLTQRSH